MALEPWKKGDKLATFPWSYLGSVAQWSIIGRITRSPFSSVVERVTCNDEVSGSIPLVGLLFLVFLMYFLEVDATLK